MNLNEFITEVHDNAVKHGWWDSDRSINESIVLIHSEWSEAVEEARAGRPMVWHETFVNASGEVIRMNAKPEGIAVELMDGVIRILDLYGKYGMTFTRTTVEQIIRATKQANPLLNKQTQLVTIVAIAHSLTAKAGDWMTAGRDKHIGLSPLEACAGLVMWWVQAQGENPEKILREKHEYNLTRPYKHGKKF